MATDLVFRLRVHDGDPLTLADFNAGIGGNALVATSLPPGNNTDSFILDEPDVDGESVDLITGKSTLGTATVRVLDPDLGGSTSPYPPGTIIDPATGLPSVQAAGDYFDDVHPAWGNGPGYTFNSKWSGTSAWYPAGTVSGSGSIGIAFGPLDGYPVTKSTSRTFTPAEFPALQPNTDYTATLLFGLGYVQKGQLAYDVNGLQSIQSTPTVVVYDPVTGLPDTSYVITHWDGSLSFGVVWETGPNEVLYGGYALVYLPLTSDSSGNVTVTFTGATSNPFQGGDFKFAKLEIFPGSPVTPPTPGERPITGVLGTDCWGLLSHRAVLERAELSDCTNIGGEWDFADVSATSYVQLLPGYVNKLHLADAITYQFTLGGTRRDEEGPPKIGDQVTAADGATCFLGGPVVGGFGRLPDGSDLVPDYGPTRWATYRVDDTDTFDSAGNPRKIVVLQFVSGYLPPGRVTVYTQVLGREADEINAYAAPYYVDDRLTWYITGQSSQHFGYYPGIAVDATPVSTGSAFVATPLAKPTKTVGWWNRGVRRDLMVETNHNGLLYVDWNVADITDDGTPAGNVIIPGMGAPPSTSTQFDVLMYPTKVGESNPIHFRGHPIDIQTGIYTRRGIPFDAASAAATKAAIGALWTDLRYTEALTVDALTAPMQAVFGYAIRVGDNAERTFFPTRIVSAAVASATNADRLAQGEDGPGPVAWDVDENSIVNAIDIAIKTYRRYDDKRDSGTRAPDDLVVGDTSVQGIRDGTLLGEHGDRSVTFSLPGSISIDDGTGTYVPLDLRAYVEAVGGVIVARYGCGAPTTEVELLATIDANIGDALDLDLTDVPVLTVGNTPPVVRGGVHTYLVTKRTRKAWGNLYTVMDAGPLSQVPPVGTPPPSDPGTTEPIPTLSIAASVADPTTIATVTITNPDLMNGLALDVELEYATGPSTPAGSGTAFGPLIDPSTTNDTIDTPAVAPGSKVWVRARASDLGFNVYSWSSWVSVVLTAQTVGGPGAPAVPPPSLSATIDATTGVLDALASVGAVVTSVKFAVGAAGGTAPTVSAVRAATADSSAPFTAASLATMAAGETRTIGALAYDAAGNESTLATLTVTRGGSAGGVTSITATAPINASASTGAVTLSHDASGVSAGTYGDATHSPQITVDAEGHITAVTDVAISGGGGGGSYSFFDPDLPQGSPSAIDDDCDGVSPPTSTDVLNSQATADYTSYPGFLAIIPTAQVNAPRARTYALPSGDGRWQCHFTLPKFLYRAGNLNYYFGVLLSTSNSYGSGKQALFILTYYNNQYQWYRQKYDNWSTFTSAPEGPAVSSYDGGEFWFRMTRSGTDWTWELSGDGAYFDKTNDTPYSESSLVSGTVTDIAPFILCNGTRRPPGLIRGIRYNSNPATVFGGIRTV